MCLIVTKAPGSHLAGPALQELDFLSSLFLEASSASRSAANLLVRSLWSPCSFISHFLFSKVSLRRLRRKAREVLGQSLPLDGPSMTPGELDRLNGKTFLFCESRLGDQTGAACSVVTSRTTDTMQAPPGVTMESFIPLGNEDNMHPTIAQDIKDYAMGAVIDFEANSIFLDLPAVQLKNDQHQQHQPDIMPHPELFQLPFSEADSLQPLTSYPPPDSVILDTTWQEFMEQLGF